MAHSPSQWKIFCCNPLNRSSHFIRKKNLLTQVTKKMCDEFPSMLPGQKICDDCRKKLVKHLASRSSLESDRTVSPPSEVPLPPDSSSQTDRTVSSPGEVPLPDSSSESDRTESPRSKDFQADTCEFVSQYLDTIGETPITKRMLQFKKYSKQEVKKITSMIQKAVIGDTVSENDEVEIITQLKEKCSMAERSEKIQILTVLPKSWSIRRIQKEFGVSNFIARKAKQLVDEKGILSTPDPKPGDTLPQCTVDLVSGFYESDETSRIMPGKKDFVSVWKVEGQTHVQKRLVLCNLRELYRMFKDKYPNESIGFFKFAELRPKHCVLAGASGTHSVCICTSKREANDDWCEAL